jgi:hypothetical protein
MRFYPLFATEHRLAIFGGSVPSYREQLQCLLIGRLCERRAGAVLSGARFGLR